MKKIFVIASMCLFLISCAKEGIPAQVSQPGRESFNVTFLFERDGVKVYRFEDGGYLRYFTTGNGSFQPQNQSWSSGKSSGSFSDGASTY